MIDKQLLEKIKAVPLPRILAEHGILPSRHLDPYGNGPFTYSAPYRTDSHPSLSVFQHNGQWLYKDHATGEVGTNLDLLVRIGFYSNWREAAAYVGQHFLGESIVGSVAERPEKSRPALQDRPSHAHIEHPGFILNVAPIAGSRAESYITDVRRIPIEVAGRYLSFVKYNYPHRPADKALSAIGWPTVKGGWALRWAADIVDGNGKKLGKTFVGPGGPSFFPVESGHRSTVCNVFEGVFDFLSFIAISGGIQTCDAIVANSTENVDGILTEMGKYAEINCFFDNDEAGRKAFSKVRSAISCAADRSASYVGFNDVNDFFRSGGTFPLY